MNWIEFTADAVDRTFPENAAIQMEGLAKAMTETRRLCDYDNYQNALIDYQYTKYKNKTQPGARYNTKEAELKQFFTASTANAN